MPRDKMICFRVTQEAKGAVGKRWISLGFASESDYMTALIKADNPGMDPARKLKGLDRGP